MGKKAPYQDWLDKAVDWAQRAEKQPSSWQFIAMSIMYSNLVQAASALHVANRTVDNSITANSDAMKANM